jgi:hypothetical protein
MAKFNVSVLEIQTMERTVEVEAEDETAAKLKAIEVVDSTEGEWTEDRFGVGFNDAELVDDNQPQYRIGGIKTIAEPVAV